MRRRLPGREALGWYHEKRDAERNLGLGPAHTWASHAADAFGLMCIDYQEPQRFKRPAPVNDIRWIV
jgi:phage terminase large subunit